MITFTDSAVEALSGRFNLTSLRFGVRGGGCSGLEYALEQLAGSPDTDWQVFEFGSLTVYVDNISLMYLDGTTVDFVTEGLYQGFKFTNPNQKRGCGCGKSFSV